MKREHEEKLADICSRILGCFMLLWGLFGLCLPVIVVIVALHFLIKWW